MANIHKTDGKITMFNVQTHYFYGHFLCRYVSLPEGMLEHDGKIVANNHFGWEYVGNYGLRKLWFDQWEFQDPKI